MGERRGTKALETWCRRLTEGYPGVKIENMTTSWRDGLAFCAIIHHFRPDLIDFSSLNKDDIYYNCSLAFSVAERSLGIPALLDAEDMVEFPVPDRLSILTYLSQFYQVFGGSSGSPTRIVAKRPAVSSDSCLSPPSTSPPTKIAAKSSNMPPIQGLGRREPCCKCSMPVFLAERLHVGSKMYHRTCFRCARCNNQLSLANCYETETDGVYCCETCPDEEDQVKPDEIDLTDATRSLSDEQKQKGLIKFDDADDEYSASFETALEDSKIAKSRREMVQGMLQDDSDVETSPKPKPRSFIKSMEVQLENSVDSGVDFEGVELRKKTEEETEPPDRISLTISVNSVKKSDSVNKLDQQDTASDVFNTNVTKDNSRQSLVQNRKLLFETQVPSAEKTSPKSLTSKFGDSSSPKSLASKFSSESTPSPKYSPNLAKYFGIDSPDKKLEETKKSSSTRPSSIENLRKTFDEMASKRKNNESQKSDEDSIKMTPEEGSAKIMSSIEKKFGRINSKDMIVGVEIQETKAGGDIKILDPKEESKTPDEKKEEAEILITKQDENTQEIIPSIEEDKSIDTNQDHKNDNIKTESDEIEPKIIDSSEAGSDVIENTPEILITQEDEPAIKPLEDFKVSSIDEDPNQVPKEQPEITTPSKPSPSLENSTPKENISTPTEDTSHAVQDISSSSIDISFAPGDVSSLLGDISSTSIEVTSPPKQITSKDDSSEPPPPLPSSRPPIIPRKISSISTISESSQKESYPSDLNPFGDDSDEESPVKPNSLKLVKPSVEDFNDPKPAVRNEGSKKVVEAPKISLNPFWSDGEEPSDDEDAGKPVPLPRNSVKTLGTPEPKPRRSGVAHEKYDSNSSLSSHTSSLGRRKKKPAPKPPVQSPGTPDTLSPNKSLNLSNSSSPRTYRKNRRAPLPPTSTPKTDVSISNTDLSASKIHSNDLELEKIDKDERNRNRQSQSITSESESLTSPVVPDKSTYGKWKRRKGPAPSRPVPQRRQIKPLPLQQLKQELDLIELQQQGLEKQGVKLEQLIREKCEGPEMSDDSSLTPEVEELVLELFELVNEKNELFRRQAELMYLRRQQRLEEEYADLEYQIRCLMNQPERNKTDSDKAREEELINRLVQVVERRNEIVECLEMDRVREAEEDHSINTRLNLIQSKREEEYLNNSLKTFNESNVKLSKKEKKKIKKEKKLKEKGKNADVDKDIDETEVVSVKEKKKRKWF